jgi:hypothetical protein
VSFDGQSHVFGRGDIPGSSLLMRDGWRLYFYPAPQRQGPWAREERTEAAALAGDMLLLNREE